MGFGLFGKLPQKRDFVSVNLPAVVLHPFETWLQSAVAASRSEIGRGWEEYYLVAPIWRFWLGREIFGTACAGALMSSVDQVGRYFPLAIIYVADDNETLPPPLLDPLDDWYRPIEERLLSVLSQDDRADIGNLLAGLATPRQVEDSRPAAAPVPPPPAAAVWAPAARTEPAAAPWAPPPRGQGSVSAPLSAPFAVFGKPAASSIRWDLSDELDELPAAAAAPVVARVEAPPVEAGAPVVAEAAPAEAEPASTSSRAIWDMLELLDPATPATGSEPAEPVAEPAIMEEPATPPVSEPPPQSATSTAWEPPPAMEPAPGAVAISSAIPPRVPEPVLPQAQVRASEFKGALLVAVESEGPLTHALGELREHDYRHASSGRSYWWCRPSAGGSALVHAGKGLPDPYFFSRMLMWRAGGA